MIRLRIPELNEERRKEMVKVAHKYAESGAVAVRHVRRDGLDLLKKMEKDRRSARTITCGMAAEVQKATDQIDRRDRPVARRQRKRDHDGLDCVR